MHLLALHEYMHWTVRVHKLQENTHCRSAFTARRRSLLQVWSRTRPTRCLWRHKSTMRRLRCIKPARRSSARSKQVRTCRLIKTIPHYTSALCMNVERGKDHLTLQTNKTVELNSRWCGRLALGYWPIHDANLCDFQHTEYHPRSFALSRVRWP